MRAAVIFLIVIGLIVVARVLASLPSFRRLARRQLQRLWAWVVERLDQPTEQDEVAEQMRMVMRGERLRADVRRVQRLLVIDTSMPATRQVGNRIAYQWLLRDLDRYAREVSEVLPDAFNLAGDSATTTTRFSAARTYRPSISQVEVLEIGWRR